MEDDDDKEKRKSQEDGSTLRRLVTELEVVKR